MSKACDSRLGLFLASSGGRFHPALYSKQDEFGTSIYTSEPLEPSTSVVSCPFSLCITPSLARRALPTSLFCPPETVAASSTEPTLPNSARKNRQAHHELLCLYLVLHLLPVEALAAVAKLDLQHEPYVSKLPSHDDMRTTLYFSPAERDLLRGSNLHGATLDRERAWKEEFDEVKTWIPLQEVRDLLTWQDWLWACTIISSRAFPSHLLDGDKSGSTPVLFPGIDMLNHKPTAKLTWSSDVHVTTSATNKQGKDGKGMLSIVVDEPVPVDTQVFNTYGAKSNEELLLGYGFVLSDPNPADCVALKLSLPPNCSLELFDLIHLLKLEGMRHFVGRNGRLPDELQAQMRLLLSPPELIQDLLEAVKTAEGAHWTEFVEFLGWETELDMLDTLEGMLESKLAALKGIDAAQPLDGAREDVRQMIEVYRQGQIVILESAIETRNKLMSDTMKRAEEEGIEMEYEDEDDS
ncbi:SET domain-containing protein [Sporobolomyces koalae]|uniref:SET domain-containing protein n=1 Tax=Sporobolomyces koalae TaxID=500713 RepID=UPI00317A5A95